MFAKLIEYREGYKYQLAAPYVVKLSFAPPHNIETDFILFTARGVLECAKGYAWDGASGLLTVQTKNTMRGSLVHDALYQLLEEGLLEASYREAADREMQRIMREDGMSAFRAGYFYRAVRMFGGSHALPENRKRIQIAP